LANGLEQPVALRGRIEGDERLVNQLAEKVEHVFIRVQLFADGLGRVHREAAGKHAKATQQSALGSGQEVVAPVKRGAKRLVPSHDRGGAPLQNPKSVV